MTIAHRRILQAIEAQEAEAARRRSGRDVTAYASHLAAAVQASAGTNRPTAAARRRSS